MKCLRIQAIMNQLIVAKDISRILVFSNEEYSVSSVYGEIKK